MELKTPLLLVSLLAVLGKSDRCVSGRLLLFSFYSLSSQGVWKFCCSGLGLGLETKNKMEEEQRPENLTEALMTSDRLSQKAT